MLDIVFCILCCCLFNSSKSCFIFSASPIVSLSTKNFNGIPHFGLEQNLASGSFGSRQFEQISEGLRAVNSPSLLSPPEVEASSSEIIPCAFCNALIDSSPPKCKYL